MAMKAVSAGQCERYHKGGGHTANSHSTTSAVAVAIPSRMRFTPTNQRVGGASVTLKVADCFTGSDCPTAGMVRVMSLDSVPVVSVSNPSVRSRLVRWRVPVDCTSTAWPNWLPPPGG